MNRHAKASSAASTSGRESGRRRTVRGAFACVLVLLAFAGIGASAAGAAVPAKGVTGFFGSSGELGGQFNNPTGMAVNQGTGNLYVADNVNRRIEVFGPNGNFLRAWGLNVVAGGPDNVPTQGEVSEAFFEVCVVANGDTCKAGAGNAGLTGGQGGSIRGPQGLAINQATGDVYATDQTARRISQFDSNGNFIRAFGKDVVTSGPDNVTEASAVQTLTVTATEGKYTLTFGGKTTSELAFNSTAAQVQAALQGLSSIGSGNATVTETSSGVYKITFAGALANNPEPLIVAASAAGEPLGGGTASVANTTTGSNGYEICSAANGDVCKEAAAAAQGTVGGAFGAAVGYPTMAPTGAPNAGNLLVADATNRRVQEFSSSGQFIRAFGFDVVKAGPDNTGAGFEVCVAANGDVCQASVAGSGSGQFATLTPTRIAEDAAGNIYTVEPATNFRVQKFTLPANVPTPQGVFDEADLKGTSATNAPGDVAVNPSTGTVSVVKGFAAGTTPSCPITGAASVAEARVLELSSAGVLEGTHGTCAGITPMSGIAIRGSSGNLYATSTLGQRVYVLNTGQPVAPAAQITNVSGITAHGASVNALINPGGPELPYGLETTYKLEYKRSVDASYSTFYSTEASAGNRTTAQAMSLSLDGLQPNTSYDVRLTANKGFGSGSASQTVSFTTASSAPEVTVASYPSVSETAVSLIGSVNPNNQATGYHFEYVGQAAFEESGFAGATKVPAEDASAGSGGAAVGAMREITGLTPGTTYHYRLVAANASGPGIAEGQFATPDAGACSNAKLRSEQVSASNPNGTTGLPECMALEMVSPPSKYNQKAENPQLSLNGDAIAFWSIGALAETPDLGSITDSYVATRGSSGWTVHPTRPPMEVSDVPYEGTPCSYSPDLSTWTQVGSKEPKNLVGQRFGLRGGIDGQFSRLSPQLVPINSNFTPALATCKGGSEDSTRFIFSVREIGFLEGDPVPPTPTALTYDANNLYEAYLDENGQPSVALLARDKNGTVVGGRCGASIGRALAVDGHLRGSISPNASRVYFETRPGQDTEPAYPCNKAGNRLRIMRRLDTPSGPQVSQVSTSECSRVSPPCDLRDGDDLYQAASLDGNRVFFTTTRQLASSDLDTGTECTRTAGESAGCDLYMYDYSLPAGARVVQISRGDSSAPTPGKGAEVLGVPDVSGDGSHVYFVGTGVLTTAPNDVGRTAEAGKPNLYVYERDEQFPGGHTAFIGTLSESLFDFETWIDGPGAASASAVPLLAPGQDDLSMGGDGHIFVFTASAPLTADDTDGGKRDVYRYNADDGTLQRVSVADPGGSENGSYSVDPFVGTTGAPSSPQSASFNRWVSEDGQAIVMSTEEPLDPSDTDGKKNAYIWHAGTVSVIAGSEGSGFVNNLGTPRPTVSRSGDEVAFVASKSLLGQDGDTTKDVYTARAGGGYPVPVPTTHCAGEACQGAPSPVPPAPISASETVTSTGNLLPPKKTKTKHKKKHRKQKRHANGNRRAGK